MYFIHLQQKQEQMQQYHNDFWCVLHSTFSIEKDFCTSGNIHAGFNLALFVLLGHERN